MSKDSYDPFRFRFGLPMGASKPDSDWYPAYIIEHPVFQWMFNGLTHMMILVTRLLWTVSMALDKRKGE